MKKLVIRALADADILSALDYYIANAPAYALAFIDDIEEAYQHISISSSFQHLAHRAMLMN